MKQYFPYILILLLVFLLHNGVTTEPTNNYQTTIQTSECSFIAQAPTSAQQAVHNFYCHLSHTTLCVDSMIYTVVPGVKSLLLWVRHLLAEGGNESDEHSFQTSLQPYTRSNPHDYYIFRLRKIVV